VGRKRAVSGPLDPGGTGVLAFVPGQSARGVRFHPGGPKPENFKLKPAAEHGWIRVRMPACMSESKSQSVSSSTPLEAGDAHENGPDSAATDAPSGVAEDEGNSAESSHSGGGDSSKLQPGASEGGSKSKKKKKAEGARNAEPAPTEAARDEGAHGQTERPAAPRPAGAQARHASVAPGSRNGSSLHSARTPEELRRRSDSRPAAAGALSRPNSRSGARSDVLEDDLEELEDPFEADSPMQLVSPPRIGAGSGSVPPPPPTRTPSPGSVAPRRAPRPESMAPAPSVESASRAPLSASKAPPPPPLKQRSAPPAPSSAPIASVPGAVPPPPSGRKAHAPLAPPPPPAPSRRPAPSSPMSGAPPRPPSPSIAGVALPPSVPPPVHASLLSPGSHPGLVAGAPALGTPLPAGPQTTIGTPLPLASAFDASSAEALDPEDFEDGADSMLDVSMDDGATLLRAPAGAHALAGNAAAQVPPLPQLAPLPSSAPLAAAHSPFAGAHAEVRLPAQPRVPALPVPSTRTPLPLQPAAATPAPAGPSEAPTGLFTPGGFSGFAALPGLAEPADGDAQPTQFDTSAEERHASPWTQEGQLEAMRAQAAQFVELLEAQLARKPERTREGRLHYEVARFYESPLRKLDLAVSHYETAARLIPQHIPTLRGARRVLLSLGRYKPALKMLEAEIAVAQDSASKATLLFQKGRLLSDHLGMKSDAREAFEQAAELAPTRLDVLKALANAEEQAAAWRKLTIALERAANASARFPAERAAYLAQMARIAATELADPKQAIELYKAALAVDPHAPAALHALKELLYQERRWKELVEALELEASLATTRDAQALAKFRAGLLWVEQLGDLARGLATIEQSSSLSPADVSILEELVRLYDVADQPKNLAAALERLAAQQDQVSVEMLHTLAQLYEERLNQPELAIERYVQALLRDPSFRPATVALARLWEQRGEWRSLAEMFNKEAETSTDPELRASLHSRIAELCELRLGSVDYAIEHHKKALELRPDFDGAFKALARLYSQLQRWHELIEVYRRRIEATAQDDERIALLFAIGRVEEEALGRPDAAAKTYEAVLAIDQSSLEAMHSLQRAAERAGEFKRLVGAIDMEVKRSKDRGRALALRHRAAMVTVDDVKDREAGIERLRAIHKDDPTYQPAIASLAELLYKDARWEELLVAYTAELPLIKASQPRAALLFKMGELCERKLDNKGQAVAHYRQAVQLDADHSAATVALRRLLTRLGQFEEVARLLESEAKLQKEPRRAARAWFLLGDVCENRLGSERPALDRALVAYKRAVELDPAFRPAIDACIRLFELGKDYKSLVLQLDHEQAEALEPMFALSAAFRAGEIRRDNLSQSKDAAASFEKIVQRDPRHVGALLALERIYTLANDTEALLQTYQRQVAAFDDADARVAAYRGYLGVVERGDKVDSELVRQTQMALLQVAPGDPQALFALEAIALATGDLTLASQVDAKLSVAGLDRSSTSAYQTRLAEAMEARGDRSALAVYRAALSHDPENLAAARGICRIAERIGAPELLGEAAEHEATILGRPDEGARMLVLAASKLSSGGDPAAAAEKLARALHIDPDHARAAATLIQLQQQGVSATFVTDTLSRAAGAATSKERRAALWVLVARTESRGRGDVGAAIAAVKRALKERPNDVEAYLLLAHFYAGSKKWDECVAQLQALLKLNPGEDVKFDALLRLATIQHEQLKATALAANNVAAALLMQPENREALELMLQVQLDREELGAAAMTAQKLVTTAKSDPERARALYHSARLQRQKGDLTKASEAFAEALSLTGTEDAVAQEYKEWLEARRAKADWRPYADALATYLRRSELNSTQLLKARRALGHALYDKLDQIQPGLEQLKAALDLAPDDGELRRGLAERLERAGEYAAALGQYEQLLRAAPHQFNYWRSLAVCYSGMGKSDQARAALAPLLASGEATDEERARFAGRHRVVAPPRPGTFGAAERELAAQGLAVSGAAVELLEAIGPALPKLYPIPFEGYRVGPKDKVVGRGGHPLRALAEDVAQSFAVQEFELYVHRGKSPGVSVEIGEQPALFVNAQVESWEQPEQVFAFARAFVNIARSTWIVDRLSVQQIELLLVCATRGHEPNFGSKLADAATLDAEVKRINKAMPWFKGNRLELAAKAFAATKLDVRRWVQETHISAIRAAAITCDDLAVALKAAALSGSDDGVLERVASYVASDAGQALRRRVFGG
jgi:cellulose synthase operon protein C